MPRLGLTAMLKIWPQRRPDQRGERQWGSRGSRGVWPASWATWTTRSAAGTSSSPACALTSD